jgi:hypothetical protein
MRRSDKYQCKASTRGSQTHCMPSIQTRPLDTCQSRTLHTRDRPRACTPWFRTCDITRGFRTTIGREAMQKGQWRGDSCIRMFLQGDNNSQKEKKEWKGAIELCNMHTRKEAM